MLDFYIGIIIGIIGAIGVPFLIKFTFWKYHVVSEEDIEFFLSNPQSSTLFPFKVSNNLLSIKNKSKNDILVDKVYVNVPRQVFDFNSNLWIDAKRSYGKRDKRIGSEYVINLREIIPKENKVIKSISLPKPSFRACLDNIEPYYVQIELKCKRKSKNWFSLLDISPKALLIEKEVKVSPKIENGTVNLEIADDGGSS